MRYLQFDSTINYPFQTDTVSYLAVIFLAFVPVPLLGLVFSMRAKSFHEFHAAVMGTWQGACLTVLYDSYLYKHSVI